MDAALALREIEALRSDLDRACDALLSAAQSGLEVSSDSPVDGEIVGGLFAELLSLCAFHDLASQRLDRLARQFAAPVADNRPDARLLQGPANGDGLDQAGADALLRGF